MSDSPQDRETGWSLAKRGSGSDRNHCSHVDSEASAPAGCSRIAAAIALKKVANPNVLARKATIHGQPSARVFRAYWTAAGTARRMTTATNTPTGRRLR